MRKLMISLISAAVLSCTVQGSIEIPRIDHVPGVNSVSPEQWATVKKAKASCSYMSCYDDKMLYLALDVVQPGAIWAGDGRGLAYFNDRLEITIARTGASGVLQIYADAGAKLYVMEGGKTVSAGQIKLFSRIDQGRGYRLLLHIPWARIAPEAPGPHAVSLKMTKVRVIRAFTGYERNELKKRFVPGQKSLSIPETPLPANRHERVINFGRPGHNSKLICDMLAAVLDYQPDLAIVMVGTNDVVWRLRWLTTEEYESFLQKICGQLAAAGCRGILVTIPPCVEEFVAKRENCTPEEIRQLMPRIAAINKVIVKLGRQYDFPVADFNALFTGDIRSETSIMRNLANSRARDGVHPTAEGYRQLAVMLKSIIDKYNLPTRRIACVGDSITYGVAMKGAGTNTGDTYPGQLLKLLNSQNQQ